MEGKNENSQKEVVLKADEKIEDLQVGGLFIIQSASQYRFTSDAVLLANFTDGLVGKKVVELCSGSGVISILVAYKQRPEKIIAVEIQETLADMAARSVALCGLQDTVSVVTGDAKCAEKVIGNNFDAVICNPPYRKIGSGERQKNMPLAIARHEIAINLKEVIDSAQSLLKFGGAFYLVHQAERLSEIITLCASSGLEPKKLCLVSSKQDSAPNLVLVKAKKGGKRGLTILPNIVMFDQDGNYTQTVKQLYSDNRE